MDRHFENIVTLEWAHEGKFTAKIVNGQIAELEFCEPGVGADGTCGKCLTSTDLKFLQSVHQSLGELFKEVEEAGKKMGYSFSLEEQK